MSVAHRKRCFMQCKNHTDVTAVDRCAGCAEPFCPDCLVEVLGRKYCGSCKVMAIKGQPVVDEEPTVPCPLAQEALTYAIVSIFCFRPILAIVALVKASKAKKLSRRIRGCSVSGKVTAAVVVPPGVLLGCGLSPPSRRQLQPPSKPKLVHYGKPCAHFFAKRPAFCDVSARHSALSRYILTLLRAFAATIAARPSATPAALVRNTGTSCEWSAWRAGGRRRGRASGRNLPPVESGVGAENG